MESTGLLVVPVVISILIELEGITDVEGFSKVAEDICNDEIYPGGHA